VRQKTTFKKGSSEADWAKNKLFFEAKQVVKVYKKIKNLRKFLFF